jgi:hypothetical protein
VDGVSALDCAAERVDIHAGHRQREHGRRGEDRGEDPGGGASHSKNCIPARTPLPTRFIELSASSWIYKAIKEVPTMPRWKPFTLVLALLVCSVAVSAQDRPQSFGTNDYTVTTISAVSFTPNSNSMVFSTSGSLGRFGALNTLTQFYVGLDLPGGAVIDYIGLNSFTDTDAAISVTLARRTSAGSTSPLGIVTGTNHSATWATDFNDVALNKLWHGQSGEALVMMVQIEPEPTMQFLGWVEIWWRRTVSDAPQTATFADVPTDHIFFQYIEALAASGITGGCGPGIFCPDAPVTRGQMATFLAKALGLHWPGASPPPSSARQ